MQRLVRHVRFVPNPEVARFIRSPRRRGRVASAERQARASGPSVDLWRKQRLGHEKFAGKPVYEGLCRHVPFGIEIAVKALSGRHPVEDLDAANFDQPVPSKRFKAGGF
jgi:hypothetical protein